MDVLRDPATASLIGLAGVIAIVLLYRFGMRRKELTYDTLSTIAALTPREELEGRLQITFDGRPIRDVSIILCQLFNSGNEPILAQDFVSALTVSPTAGAILSAEIIEVLPAGLGAQAELVDGRARLVPLLLNQGDLVTLRLVATEYRGPLLVDARIVGVSRLRTVLASGTWAAGVGSVVTVFAMIEGAAIALVVLALIPGFETLAPQPRGFVITMAIIAGVLSSYALLQRWALGPQGSSLTYRRVVAERERARRTRNPTDR